MAKATNLEKLFALRSSIVKCAKIWISLKIHQIHSKKDCFHLIFLFESIMGHIGNWNLIGSYRTYEFVRSFDMTRVMTQGCLAWT